MSYANKTLRLHSPLYVVVNTKYLLVGVFFFSNKSYTLIPFCQSITAATISKVSDEDTHDSSICNIQDFCSAVASHIAAIWSTKNPNLLSVSA